MATTVAMGVAQLFFDPYTGEKLGSRKWGEVSLAKENLLPFLYVLHYALTIPGDWGVWLMGIVAALWTLDCFVGFYLTLPRGEGRSGTSGRRPGASRPARGPIASTTTCIALWGCGCG